MGGKNDDSVHFDQHFNIFYIISVQGKFSICKTLMCTLFEGWGGGGRSYNVHVLSVLI